MGIGEGLLNCNELFPALEMLTSPDGFTLSPRRITVSTSGYVPGMLKFAELKKEYNLAVSLHAPDEETRSKIIPDTLRFPIPEILSAVDRYKKEAGRIVTLEYTLLAGINDSDAQAAALGRLAFAHHAKVNLIPYNSTGSSYRRPSRERIESFERAVAAAGAAVTRRIERGSNKNAACGQLRIQAEKKD
jgi:23S rRNA (adenine2503-C2)-methyltransferase